MTLQPRLHAERGFALILVSVAVLVVAGVVFAGIERGVADDARGAVDFAVRGQAHAVARAGIVDAIAWLRRQTTQPVVDFHPDLDLSAEVPVFETEQPELGIIRTFEIAPSVWARYEVRQGRPMDPYTDVNLNGVFDEGEPFVDLLEHPNETDNTLDLAVAGTKLHPQALRTTAAALDDGFADGLWTAGRWTRNVAEERGMSGAGSVWRIESRGIVYRMVDPDVAPGEDPNRILGQATLATEVKRLVISAPAAAALCAGTPEGVELGNRCRVRADTLAVAVATPGSPLVSAGAEVLAPTVHAAVPDYADRVVDVFGVDWAELQSMSDISTSADRGVPDQIADYTLVTLDGDVSYGPGKPLRGKGVLAVHGNFTIASDSNSFFTGLIYVDGNVVLKAPAYLRGTIICTGTLLIEGSGVDYIEIEHDPVAISDLLTVMGQYLVTRAVYPPDRRLLGAGAAGH